jgi:hypothetical protein
VPPTSAPLEGKVVRLRGGLHQVDPGQLRRRVGRQQLRPGKPVVEAVEKGQPAAEPWSSATATARLRLTTADPVNRSSSA